MSSVLTQCPVHGLRRAESMVAGINSSVEFVGSSQTCPVPGCGRQARILDGSYSLRDDTDQPTVFTPTPAERIRLRNILAWAEEKLADDLVDDSDVAASLERGLRKDAPGIAGWLDKLGGAKSMGIATWVMLLLMVYQIVTQGEVVSTDDLQRAVEEGVRQVQEQGIPGLDDQTPINPEQDGPPANPAE